MKTNSFSTKSELKLWNPQKEGEAILGRYEKTIDTENGKGMIFEIKNEKILVPVWVVLQSVKEGIDKQLKNNDDIFVLLIFTGSSESSNGTYKNIDAHILVPTDDDELDECFNLSDETSFKEGKKGAQSTVNVASGGFKKALKYFGIEDGSKLLD